MTRILAVISGKGGVGKTTVTSNLSSALSKLGKEVIAVDANLTTPNLGIHLGMHLAPVTLHDVLKGKMKLRDCIYPHPFGFKVIPASMKVEDLTGVDPIKLEEVTLSLLGKSDFVILDSAAGLGREAVSAISAVDEILVVANPELPSLTEALKTVKLAEMLEKNIVGVVLNKVRKKKYELKKEDAEEIVGYPVIAEIPEDKNVVKSVSVKMPVVDYAPYSPASVEFMKLACFLAGVDLRIEKKNIFRKILEWIVPI